MRLTAQETYRETNYTNIVSYANHRSPLSLATIDRETRVANNPINKNNRKVTYAYRSTEKLTERSGSAQERAISRIIVTSVIGEGAEQRWWVRRARRPGCSAYLRS